MTQCFGLAKQASAAPIHSSAVCFTPSQGVCTPSPTNMAQMWAPQPFASMPGSPYASPGSPYAYAPAYNPYVSWEAMVSC